MSPCSLCTFFVCLIGVSVGLDLAQALHIPPNRPILGSLKEIPRPTILSSMKHDLTSNFGSCSFPPEDVLSDYGSDQSPFGFLEKCNVLLPKPEANAHAHRNADVLLCMALYDIGLRMCGTNQTVHNRITNRIPHNAVEFQKVLNEDVDALLRQKGDSLCSSLETVLYEPIAIQTKYWNLKKTFLTKKSACGKICIDYDDSENEFCKLIFWGSNLLRETNSYDDYMDNNPTLPSGSQLGAKASLSDKVSDVKDSRPNSQSEPEIQIVEHQPAISLAAEQVIKPNVPGSIMSVLTDSPSLSHDESNLKPKDESVRSEVPSTEENQKSSSISKTINVKNTGKDTLPAVTQEHPPTNYDETKKDTIDRERKPDGTSTSNSKTGPTDVEPKKETPTLAEKTSLDTILDQEKHVEANKFITVQSSKSSSSEPVSKSVSISKSTSTTESGIGMVQAEDSVQKVSGNEGNQDMASEELPDDEPPLDQGEEDDEINFPKADLEQPDKAGTSDNDNYFKTGSREEMTNGNVYVRDRFEQSEDSHFFGYFLTMVIFCFVGYFVFHNKQKILALAVEGRSRRGSNRRRPNTAKYHKLDSNLEEAVSSPCNTSVTHVIY